MSLISSKQTKKHVLVDPIFVFLVLVLILLVIMPANGATYNSAGSVLIPFSKVPATIAISFAADLQYWNTNCSHGWATDSACANISARAQSCSISADSAYCSEYRSYLQDYLNQ